MKKITKMQDRSDKSSSPALSYYMNTSNYFTNLLNLDQNTFYNIPPEKNNAKAKVKEKGGEPMEVQHLNMNFLENILKKDITYQSNHIPIFLNSLNIPTQMAKEPPQQFEEKKQKKTKIGKPTEEEKTKKFEANEKKRKKPIRKIN